jgi:transmembrane sensor
MEQERNIDLLIRQFINGTLNTEKENELLCWIKRSEENRKHFLKVQEELNPSLTSKPSQEAVSQWNALSKKISEKSNQKRRGSSTKKRLLQITTMAASLLIGVILTSIYFQSHNKPVPETVQNTQTISTPKGARSNFILPDGSTVWLNSGSSLTFSNVNKKERNVTLIGEAYFKVVKDKKPFIVSTTFGDVKVFGTSFNVKAYSDDDFLTTLEEGSVKVASSEKNSEVNLKPGQQAYFNQDHSELATRDVNTNIYTSWKDGVLIFNKDPLDVMVKKLERWYNVDIQLTPRTKIKNFRFTGTIEMETLSEVLQLIRVTAPIEYNYDAKKRIVTIDIRETKK